MANVAATSSTSALDLLRPDPPIDKPDASIKQEVVEEEEDELVIRIFLQMQSSLTELNFSIWLSIENTKF